MINTKKNTKKPNKKRRERERENSQTDPTVGTLEKNLGYAKVY